MPRPMSPFNPKAQWLSEFIKRILADERNHTQPFIYPASQPSLFISDFNGYRAGLRKYVKQMPELSLDLENAELFRLAAREGVVIFTYLPSLPEYAGLDKLMAERRELARIREEAAFAPTLPLTGVPINGSEKDAVQDYIQQAVPESPIKPIRKRGK